MRINITDYAKKNTELFTELYDKYKQTKPILINKEISNEKSSRIGTYIEKYIEYKIEPNNEFKLEPGLVDLRNIQIPVLEGLLEFNKIIYFDKFIGEVDIFEIDGPKISIMDIKCVTKSCEKYCFVEQSLYSYVYYKVKGKIPENQIYFVYAEKTWKWELDLDDMLAIEKIVSE